MAVCQDASQADLLAAGLAAVTCRWLKANGWCNRTDDFQGCAARIMCPN